MPTAFENSMGKRAFKNCLKIIKLIYISRSQNVYKFFAISKNILNIFLAQTLRKFQQF